MVKIFGRNFHHQGQDLVLSPLLPAVYPNNLHSLLESTATKLQSVSPKSLSSSSICPRFSGRILAS